MATRQITVIGTGPHRGSFGLALKKRSLVGRVSSAAIVPGWLKQARDKGCD